MKAIEVVGTIEENRRVRLDEPLPPGIAGRVRLIILVGEDEPTEQQWLHAAAGAGAFDFLHAPEEDRYTLRDGGRSMTRGKVVRVPFPFDDLTTQKARPAICLTEPLTSHRHIVLAFITSRQPEELLDTDIELDQQDPDFAQTGLQVRRRSGSTVF